MSASSDEDLDEEPPESPSPKGKGGKWWHVPDEKIEALVGFVHSPPGEAELDGCKTFAYTSAVAGGDSAGTRRKGRSVRFHGQEEEDSLDRMLRRTRDKLLQSPEAPPKPNARGEKSWKISDQEIEKLVLSMSSSALPDQLDRLQQSAKLNFAGNAVVGGHKAATRAAAAADDRIDVWIHFLQSEDKMRLRVSLDLPIGPPKAPASNRFRDMYGLGASTRGFDRVKQSFDHRRRKFSDRGPEEWVPEWSGSLKGMIEELAEVEIPRIRLFYRNFPMSNDQMTLRSYGIKDGETLMLRIQKWVPGMISCNRDVLLASSKRLHMCTEKERDETNKYDGYSLRLVKRVNEFRKADGDVYMQPKWLAEKNPRLFAKVGIALGDGTHQVTPHPADSPIFIQDRDNENLRRVRLSVAGRT